MTEADKASLIAQLVTLGFVKEDTIRWSHRNMLSVDLYSRLGGLSVYVGKAGNIASTKLKTLEATIKDILPKIEATDLDLDTEFWESML